MAALPNSSLVSVDEYLDRGLDAEFEYLEGVLVPRRSANPLHSRMVAIITSWLDDYASVIDVYSALTLNVKADRFRIPDVCFYSKTGLQPDPFLAPSNPPLATFEVISPTDTFDGDILDKCADYDALGIEYQFLVDPKRRNILRPHSSGGLHTVDLIQIPVASFTIEARVTDLFSKLNH